MNQSVTWFIPPPTVADRPTAMGDLFAADAFRQPIHPLAQAAAAHVIAELPGATLDALQQPGAGKMFGVLVVADASRTLGTARIGFLRGFSGKLDGVWQRDGFVPPLFDEAARALWWTDGEAYLATLDAQLQSLEQSAAWQVSTAAVLAADAAQTRELLRLRDEVTLRRVARATLREQHTNDVTMLDRLDDESRRDGTLQREAKQRLTNAVQAARATLQPLTAAHTQLRELRSATSRRFMQTVYDEYQLHGPDGKTVPLRSCFAPHDPPGGAGDCAAPKLVGFANTHGLQSLALAEFWIGAPPTHGGRVHGVFYPPCRGKCGAILPRMLPPVVTSTPALLAAPHSQLGPSTDVSTVAKASAPQDTDELRIWFQDDRLAVVEKPSGMLSIPGRGPKLANSLQTRLQLAFQNPTATVAHRLDQDTSGLMIVCLDAATLAAMHNLFARRDVTKHYIAILDGTLPTLSVGSTGSITLPLRPDHYDRPRQIVDVELGKSAQTDFQVLSIVDNRTRVRLSPLTGRTHQLRIHAAHLNGLGVAIVGDRIYGRGPDATVPRMMLHAASLRFVHPWTGQAIEVESPVPF